MEQHLSDRGWNPVRSFVLYLENRRVGLTIHEGVGTVGRTREPALRTLFFGSRAVLEEFRPP